MITAWPVGLVGRAKPGLILSHELGQHGHCVDRDLVAPDDLADNSSLFVEDVIVFNTQRDGALRPAGAVVSQEQARLVAISGIAQSRNSWHFAFDMHIVGRGKEQ